MSLKNKLEREFEAGFVQGVESAWSIFDNSVKHVKGIGPETQRKLKEAIVQKATEYYKAQRGVK